MTNPYFAVALFLTVVLIMAIAIRITAQIAFKIGLDVGYLAGCASSTEGRKLLEKLLEETKALREKVEKAKAEEK